MTRQMNSRAFGNDQMKPYDDEYEGEGSAGNYQVPPSCNEAEKLFDLSTIPPVVRLSMRRKTDIKLLMDKVPQPRGGVPKTHLPSWVTKPLIEKLPRVPCPKGALVYVRGQVTENLVRPNPHFNLDDPHGFRRITIQHSTYEGLHDPINDKYLANPVVAKLLLDQGLITPSGGVVCSLKEFNRWRIYLDSLYKDAVHDAIDENELALKMQADLVKRVQKFESQTAANGKDRIKAEKIANVKRLNEKHHLELVKYQEEKAARDKERAARFKVEKEREILNRRILRFEKEQERKWRVEMIKRDNDEYAESVKQYIVDKEKIVEGRKKSDKELRDRAYRQFLLEWVDAKWEFQEDSTTKNELIEKTLRADHIKKVGERQMRIQRYRESLPELMKKRKAEEARVWELVRKFFYRWLGKVRARHARKPDFMHQSLWDMGVALEDTLKYLRKESGYEKFDDFIMNIIKLKREIKAQLEAEDAAAEAQANELVKTVETEAADENEEVNQPAVD